MPTLDWIGKDAVVRHHKEVPFRLLEPDKKLSCGDPDSGNLWAEMSQGRCRFVMVTEKKWREIEQLRTHADRPPVAI